ncbi:hypothetical protein ABT369_54470 [Dactylosporangium sp. NPDC000244]|uniref:hypothetical protein n=1 Tax=Dactylosporangium sp. NPDC000244 TaxID=3154365 RepID=UPI00332B4D85
MPDHGDVPEAPIAPVAAVARWDAWRSITAPTPLAGGERGTRPPAEDERMV